MISICHNDIIGIAELQKVSAKKLLRRRRDRPLLVMDRKSGQRVFVIMSYRDYENLLAKEGDAPRESVSREVPGRPSPPTSYDFAAHGLFWDEPGMTNASFRRILGSPAHPRHAWAATRVLERLPSRDVLAMVAPARIAVLVKSARLRPFFKEAWENALAYFAHITPRHRPAP